MILCSNASQITSPTLTTVLKILYGYASSYSIESYFLNINYVDSATDTLTIGGLNSAFIGCIKNFQIFIGTSTAFISIILSIFISYIIISVTIKFPMCSLRLSIVNRILLYNIFYQFLLISKSILWLYYEHLQKYVTCFDTFNFIMNRLWW